MVIDVGKVVEIKIGFQRPTFKIHPASLIPLKHQPSLTDDLIAQERPHKVQNHQVHLVVRAESGHRIVEINPHLPACLPVHIAQ
jgi:hypothetical protein